VQALRKTSGLEVTDRINLTVSSDEAVQAAVSAYEEYIKAEVLALSIEMAAIPGESVDLNGHTCTISIAKS